jgi:hypothetical protein
METLVTDHFQRLPIETLREICYYLYPSDILRISSCDCLLRQTFDEHFWHNHLSKTGNYQIEGYRFKIFNVSKLNYAQRDVPTLILNKSVNTIKNPSFFPGVNLFEIECVDHDSPKNIKTMVSVNFYSSFYNIWDDILGLFRLTFDSFFLERVIIRGKLKSGALAGIILDAQWGSTCSYSFSIIEYDQHPLCGTLITRNWNIKPDTSVDPNKPIGRLSILGELFFPIIDGIEIIVKDCNNLDQLNKPHILSFKKSAHIIGERDRNTDEWLWKLP